MFKFAANKLAGSGSAAATSASAQQQTTSGQITGPAGANSMMRQGGEANSIIPPGAVMMMAGDSSSSSASARRRCQIQKDLFAYNKIADKGFPSKPSAMDYDRKLKLLAIGTKNGDIRIYGEPGTLQQQLSCYQDVHPFPILRLVFVQGLHQLITLSERVYRNDTTNKGESNLFLVLWQIPNLAQLEHSTGVGSNLVEKVKEYQLEPKIVNNTRLSALALLNDNSHLFIGFESGDVYVFNVSAFQMVPGVINKDYILKNLPAPTSPDQKKLTSLGAVESICHHPRLLTKLLIAYQRGLWIVFDFIKNQIEQINQTQQQLESAVFYQHGECVATAHSDGSFILWDLSSATPIQSASSSGDQPTTSTTTASPASGTPTTCSSSSAPNIVYGPYPCKAVNKCMVKTCRADQPYVIFSGGCPRVNYSDKITITVIQGEQSHVCFDFTSKIIEFFTIDKPSIEKTNASSNAVSTPNSTSTTIVYDNPQALFVLLEEEFVAIDLVSEGWPQYKLPYLCSVHSSAIICTHYANAVSRSFYDKLVKYGAASNVLEPGEVFSERDWPIGATNNHNNGNNALVSASSSTSDKRDLLLTGHEDGSVRFWDVTNMSMTLLYRLKTSDYFQTDSTPMCGGDAEQASEDNWPPFRKVGTFDPYSDDPKLGVQKIQLCARRELIAVAGTAGQVLLMSLNDQAVELPFANIVAHKINIIGSSPEIEAHFVWKGHEGLLTRGRLEEFNSKPTASSPPSSPVKIEGSMKLAPGFQLQTLVQLYPPATVSSLALNTDWQLIGVGTSYGFALFDFNHSRELLIRCTLDPATSSSMGEAGAGGTSSTISRRKSLKKSLRESFRKLRRGRSQKPGAKKPDTAGPGANSGITSRQLAAAAVDDDLADGALHRPIERQVESREFKPVDDIPASVIRYIYFVRTHITSNQQQTNSMWVGTNTGIIYIYALQFVGGAAAAAAGPSASGSKSISGTSGGGTLVRTNQTINCLLAKEMRLKHRAPVVHIQVLDQNMQPLPLDPTEATSSSATSSTATPSASESQHHNASHHKVIICSEEQFKVFQLPTLKPVCKFKLTAVEGARVRRIGYTNYVSRQDARYHEYCLSCLSNLGDISVYSLPSLKRQVQIQCMKQQDINAITSFVFSKQGQAFYLQSASEFVHISMSARDSPPTLTQLALLQQRQQQQQQNNQSPHKEVKQVAKKQPSQEKTIKPQTATTTTTATNPTTTTSSTSTTTNAPTSQQTPAKTTTTTTTPSTTTTSTAPNPVSPTTTTGSDNAAALSSPKSPPPPVPAPRTTIANTNNNSLKDDSSRASNNDDTPVSPKSEKTKTVVESKVVDLPETTVVDENGEKKEAATSFECPDVAVSPIKKRQMLPVHQPRETTNVDLSNSSPGAVSSASAMHSTSTLNQSSMTVVGGNPMANCSMSTDSFNVSSSGYTGSSSNTFNLSMDSVVDKFNDEFSQLKIPSSIDEDAVAATANDSLLNESQTASASTNGHTAVAAPPVPTSRLTNGHNGHQNGVHTHHNQNGKTNGHNHEKRTSNSTATNGLENGCHVNNGANVTDDETTTTTSSSAANTSLVDMSVGPQKASSPLAKMTNGQNGHSVPLNIEQVTKRIENGNKLEYRETAID